MIIEGIEVFMTPDDRSAPGFTVGISSVFDAFPRIYLRLQNRFTKTFLCFTVMTTKFFTLQ